MIFPFRSRSHNRDPLDPIGRIDREIADRPRRLAIGLSLEDDFRTLSGALIVVEGKGKYLRLIRAWSSRRTLSPLTSAIIEKLATATEIPFLEYRQVQLEIAVAQSELVSELQLHAGKYVDRLLILALSDPGCWIADNETERICLPISDPNLIADATGISVIDCFPAGDVLAGGSGRNLDALPAWILFADRSAKRACRDRILFSIHETARAFFLPASDGLDVDVPDIRFASGPGLGLLRRLRPDGIQPGTDAWILQQNIDGQFNTSIAEKIGNGDIQGISKLIDVGSVTLADCVRSAIVTITARLTEAIRPHCPAGQAPEIFVDCPSEMAGALVNQLHRLWDPAEFVMDGFAGLKIGGLNAALTATLGMISVDQLPANLPSITGADSQKNLGRFTPGTPCNWRQLLREMADFQPPAMRLRDAV